MGCDDQRVRLAKNGVKISPDPTCRCFSQFGHEIKPCGLIKSPEIIDTPVVGAANACFVAPSAAGICPAVMSKQHGVLGQPNHSMILEVMQVAHPMAKLSDFRLCGVE